MISGDKCPNCEKLWFAPRDLPAFPGPNLGAFCRCEHYHEELVETAGPFELHHTIRLGGGEQVTLIRAKLACRIDSTIERDPDDAHYTGMVDGFEALLLALFAAGVKLPRLAVLDAWQAIGNHT